MRDAVIFHRKLDLLAVFSRRTRWQIAPVPHHRQPIERRPIDVPVVNQLLCMLANARR